MPATKNTAQKFTKVARGWYATADGTYAVIADGYKPGQHVGAEEGTGYEGFIAGEWAAVYCPRGDGRTSSSAGDNIDWFATKGAAVAECARHAARTAR